MSRVVQSSALSRNSAEVFQAADQGTVEITRRDGETLVLTRKSELERQSTVLRMAADLIAASLGPEAQPFVDRLQGRFPWMRFLSEPERETFAMEIVDSAVAVRPFRTSAPFSLICRTGSTPRRRRLQDSPLTTRSSGTTTCPRRPTRDRPDGQATRGSATHQEG
jgi:hypothetical protein